MTLPESEFKNVLEFVLDHYKAFQAFPHEYEDLDGRLYDISYLQDAFYNIMRIPEIN